MFVKILLLLSALFVATCEGGWFNLGYGCVYARGDHFKSFTYRGPNGFMSAFRLIHRSGRIGCAANRFTFWGCDHHLRTNMYVTDVRNVIMYPSPVLVKAARGGWYKMPGYFEDSPSLVFSDVGTRYIYHGQQVRIWYGEDLYGFTESDNHGRTCFVAQIYFVNHA